MQKIALTVYILLAIFIVGIFIASWIMYAEYEKYESKIKLLRTTSGITGAFSALALFLVLFGYKAIKIFAVELDKSLNCIMSRHFKKYYILVWIIIMFIFAVNTSISWALFSLVMKQEDQINFKQTKQLALSRGIFGTFFTVFFNIINVSFTCYKNNLICGKPVFTIFTTNLKQI